MTVPGTLNPSSRPGVPEMSRHSYQNIPQMVGCPCRTASSLSGAPARLQGGRREHCPKKQEKRGFVIPKVGRGNKEHFRQTSPRLCDKNAAETQQKRCRNALLPKTRQGLTSQKPDFSESG